MNTLLEYPVDIQKIIDTKNGIQKEIPFK